MAMMYALARIYDWGNRAAWAFVAVIVPLSLYVAIYTAPAERAIAERQSRHEIDRKNRTFCEKYGMAVGTRDHILCNEDLMKIRAQQDKLNTDNGWKF
jgi:hypothetical protein